MRLIGPQTQAIKEDVHNLKEEAFNVQITNFVEIL
jgi:hypothetical protein